MNAQLKLFRHAIRGRISDHTLVDIDEENTKELWSVGQHHGLHPHDLTLSLQRLVREGLLVADGRSRGTVYHLPGEQLPTPEQVFGEMAGPILAGTPSLFAESSAEQSEISGGLAASSGGLAASSGAWGRSSGPFGRKVPELDRPIVDTLDALDEAYLAELLDTAHDVAKQGKCAREIVERTVLELCARAFLTLGVLARLLDRSEEYLRKYVLNPMVADKRLRRAFPSRPNDPRQAYTSSESEQGA